MSTRGTTAIVGPICDRTASEPADGLHDSAAVARTTACRPADPDVTAKSFTIAVIEDFHAYAYMQLCGSRRILDRIRSDL